MARGNLTDQERSIVGLLLPPEHRSCARPAGENHPFVNSVLHVLPTKCPWRDMRARYSKWNLMCVRFRRSAGYGVWDALQQILAVLNMTDDWHHMLDGTMVCAHSHAARANVGLIWKVLVDFAEALRARSMPDAIIGDGLSVLLPYEARSQTTKPHML